MSCVCQDTFEIKQGATKPGVLVQLLETYVDDNGETKTRVADDIPDLSTVAFKMHGIVNGSRAEIIPPTPATWYDFEEKLVAYDFISGQTDSSGIYSGYIDVTDPGGGVETFGGFRINIVEL